jgi:hypothetical protein
MKFAFFVKPFPEESPFSILMRLKEKLAFNDEEFSKYVLDNRNISLKIIEGRIDLDHFKRIFGDFFSVSNEEWFSKYNLLFQFKSYTNESRFRSLLNYNHKSLNTFRFESGESSGCYIKYCKKCLEDDFQQFHNYFLRKNHQLIGVYVCLKHKIPLKYFKLIKVNKNSISTIIIRDLIDSDAVKDFELLDFNNFYRLSKNAVNAYKVSLSPNEGKYTFIHTNYVDKNGRVDYSGLARDLWNYYGAFLAELESIYFHVKIDEKLIKSTFMLKSSIYDPVLCLLLFQLNDELIWYPELKPVNKLFKKISHCQNLVCKYYSVKNAILIEVKKWHRDNYTAYYSCSNCKMVYSKSYFKEKESNKIRIIEYGNLFLEALKDLVNSKTSMAKMTRTLGIHNVTIFRQLALNSIEHGYLIRKPESTKRKLKYRKVFDSLLDSGIKISKARLLKEYKKEFEYLRMYDHAYYIDRLKYLP